MQFRDIEGQSVIANKLTEVIDSGRVAHAQMFVGSTSSGSLALAVAYAQYLNCANRQHYENPEAHDGLRADSCGHCPNCMKYEQMAHSDLHLIFPTMTSSAVASAPSSAKYLGLFKDFLAEYQYRGSLNDWYTFAKSDKQGEIRDADADVLRHVTSMTTYENVDKVIIVWMAEKMNGVFANKILKTLEEPYPHTVLILVAEDVKNLLPTIVSRVQQVTIPEINQTELVTMGDLKMSLPVVENFAKMYVEWMRQLFKLNMESLSTWVEQVAALGKEDQKLFLLFAQEATRECFLSNNASIQPRIDFGDAKFNSSFPSMITIRNIEGLDKAFSDMYFAIEHNSHSKITFMELSFRISKLLQKKRRE